MKMVERLFINTLRHPLAMRGIVEMIPIEFVRHVANPDATEKTCLGNWENNHHRVNHDELFDNMIANGMRDPFILSVGRISRTVRLEAGNHRVQCLFDRKVTHVPCVALITDHGIKHEGNGLHKIPMELLIEPGDPIFGPYDEHIYDKPSKVIKKLSHLDIKSLDYFLNYLV